MQANIRLCAISRWAFMAIVLAGGGASPASAADDSASSPPDMARLVDDLGDDDFQVRQKAARQLAELASQAQRRDDLARLVRTALDRVETPYEARRQLENLAPLLPQAKPEIPAEVSDAELDQLIAMLDGETYGARIGAAARLTALVERPSLACRIVERLRPLRRSTTLSRQTRQRLEPIWDKGQLVWLSSDPRTWHWPPVDEEQVDHLLHLLVRPLPPPAADESLQETRPRLERKRRLSQREAAQAELLALLVRDDSRQSRRRRTARGRPTRRRCPPAAHRSGGLDAPLAGRRAVDRAQGDEHS
jgi:hypothetical protein